MTDTATPRWPLPWRVDKNGHKNSRFSVVQPIGIVMEDDTAALVVTAVNAHDRLLAALRALADWSDGQAALLRADRTGTQPSNAALRKMDGKEDALEQARALAAEFEKEQR